MTIGHSVGKRTRFLTYVSGLNQSQLAARAGVRQSVISGLEGGQVADVHLGTLIKLKRVFRTSWDDLFAEVEAGSRQKNSHLTNAGGCVRIFTLSSNPVKNFSQNLTLFACQLTWCMCHCLISSYDVGARAGRS